jgi:hypothetical protein
MSNDLAENVSVSGSAVASYISGFQILIENAAYVFRFSWKWRRRSPNKVKERAHEEATEALPVGREGRHPQAAFAGE